MSTSSDNSKASATDRRLLLLSPQDNVLVLVDTIKTGEQILIHGIYTTIDAEIGIGHKLAAVAIPANGKIYKYGAAIGSATQNIALGEHVHIHNMKSDYTPTFALEESTHQTESTTS